MRKQKLQERHRQAPRVSPARDAARRVLMDVERSGRFADELMARWFAEGNLAARDRALCMELTYGVLRHRATLDWRLEHVSDRGVKGLPADVRTALRLGAYQLLYLDRIPTSAAVNESVLLVGAGRRSDAARWKGFANAVLRALLREPAPPPPDPIRDPVRALSVRRSCPPWLAARWLARYGAEVADELCRAAQLVPPLTLRTNTLELTREELLARLDRAGVAAGPTSVSPVGVTVEKRGEVTEFPYYEDGLYYLEDEAAQLIPPLLAPQPGERVLDACAAPGGKATHLAALMLDDGEVVAVDRDPVRLRSLQENCARLGITCVRAVAHDWLVPEAGLPNGPLAEGRFDAALVDAPCSGLGVLKRHPEAKWRKEAEALEQHQARQLAILDRVAALLRPGARLVYSTCSTEPEENEHVIEQFCRRHGEFQRERVEPWIPEGGRTLLTSHGFLSTVTSLRTMDAFFACRLRKTEP